MGTEIIMRLECSFIHPTTFFKQNTHAACLFNLLSSVQKLPNWRAARRHSNENGSHFPLRLQFAFRNIHTNRCVFKASMRKILQRATLLSLPAACCLFEISFYRCRSKTLTQQALARSHFICTHVVIFTQMSFLIWLIASQMNQSGR